MSFLVKLTPRLPKRYLLFLAAMVWTFAGGMLLIKGFGFLKQTYHLFWIRIFISLTGGNIFYILMFSKISIKHTQRIINLKIEKPCMFSFFNFKSYLLMGIMITGGIVLRTSGLIPVFYLSVVYLTMGIPLFISAFRFYFTGIFYKVSPS